MGRYQHKKAQGVKISSHRIDRPKSTPLLVSAKNHARQASRFRNRVTECTGDGERERAGLMQSGQRCPPHQVPGRKNAKLTHKGNLLALYLDRSSSQIMALRLGLKTSAQP